MPKFHIRYAVIAFLVIEVLVIGLTCLGAALDQFTVKSGVKGYHGVTISHVVLDDKSCFTFWGFKKKCSSTSYTFRGSQAYGCPQRRDMMIAGGAFALAAIVLELCCVLFAVAMLYYFSCIALVPFNLAGFAAILLCVSWGYTLSVYTSAKYCKDGYYLKGYKGEAALNLERTVSPFKTFTSLGAGFAALIAAFVCQLVNVALLILMVIT